MKKMEYVTPVTEIVELEASESIETAVNCTIGSDGKDHGKDHGHRPPQPHC